MHRMESSVSSLCLIFMIQYIKSIYIDFLGYIRSRKSTSNSKDGVCHFLSNHLIQVEDLKYSWIVHKLTYWLTFHLREGDVAAIDVNMGCPKDYSIKVCGVKIHKEVFVVPNHWLTVCENQLIFSYWLMMQKF